MSDTPTTADVVARAIHDAEYADEPWKKFDTLDPDDQNQYRFVATRVLAALELTDETVTIPNVVNRVECTCGIGTAGNEDMHSCGFTRGRFTFTPSRRLVGPWQEEQK